MQKMDIGLVGLGVMGENLALNLERNGFSVSGFDLDSGRRDSFGQRTQGLNAHAVQSLAELVNSLQQPRRIWLMALATW
jgi:6-phosphogluconate dehydrogenase